MTISNSALARVTGGGLETLIRGREEKVVSTAFHFLLGVTAGAGGVCVAKAWNARNKPDAAKGCFE